MSSPMCQHQPSCPSADALDHDAARAVASFPEQGWSLLCNGVILFEDTGEIMPDGSSVVPHRGPAPHNAAYAAA
jgi:Family of unknown function (DUF5999)